MDEIIRFFTVSFWTSYSGVSLIPRASRTLANLKGPAPRLVARNFFASSSVILRSNFERCNPFLFRHAPFIRNLVWVAIYPSMRSSRSQFGIWRLCASKAASREISRVFCLNKSSPRWWIRYKQKSRHCVFHSFENFILIMFSFTRLYFFRFNGKNTKRWRNIFIMLYYVILCYIISLHSASTLVVLTIREIFL